MNHGHRAGAGAFDNGGVSHVAWPETKQSRGHEL